MKKTAVALIAACSLAACASDKKKPAGADGGGFENPIDLSPFSVAEIERESSNAELSAYCEQQAAAMYPRVNFEVVLITTSRRWGAVWRSDVVASNGRKGRLVCWSPREADTDGVMTIAKFLDETDRTLSVKSIAKVRLLDG